MYQKKETRVTFSSHAIQSNMKQVEPHKIARAPRPGCTKIGLACKKKQANPLENPTWSSPQSPSSSSAPSSLPLVKPPWRLKLFKKKLQESNFLGRGKTIIKFTSTSGWHAAKKHNQEKNQKEQKIHLLY
jgi:hypothetical protein